MEIFNVDNEYKKFPETEKSDVLKLLLWLDHQPHLPKIKEWEAFLFLHSCWNSVELAKQTIDIYYTTRTHCPEFFFKRDVHGDDIRRTMDFLAVGPLPYVTPAGNKVLIGKLSDLTISKFHFADSIKLYFMCFDLWLAEEGTADGYIIVIDLQGGTFGHTTRLGPMIVKKFLLYLQDSCPVKLKGFHFINILPFMDTIQALMRPFMKKDLSEVLKLHKTVETLYEYVPKECLPVEYGGTQESFEIFYKKYYKHVIQNAKFFEDEERTRRVDESKRPGKPKQASDVFGVEGNFKKLDID